MDGNKEDAQEAQGGREGTAAIDKQHTHHVDNKEFQGFKDVEVDNKIEHRSGEKSVEIVPKEPEHVSFIANVEAQGDSHVFHVERKYHPLIDNNAKESCSESVALAKNLSQGQAEDENCEKELKDKVPEFSSAENGSGQEDMDNDFMPTRDVQKEEEVEGQVKGREVLAKNPKEESSVVLTAKELLPANGMELKNEPGIKTPSKSFLLDANDAGDESGTEEEQAAFMKELETFHRERCLDFKPPKFYQEPLNCLKLWRAVIRLGGYEQVTSMKLWRQVGESFRPPKTCTTVSWTFRGFYEKALLEYEKYKMRNGELPFTDASLPDPASGNQVDLIHASGSGRARRDAAARAMQGWHSQRLLGNGEVGDPIIKDKNLFTTPRREKQLRNIGFLKRKGSSPVEHAVKVARGASKSQLRYLI